MAGLATLRSGAGLVTLAVPQSVQDVVASFCPCYMTYGLPDENGQFTAAAADEIVRLAANFNVFALGPGLARSDNLTAFVQALYREVPLPMVVDADALFALAERPIDFGQPGGPRILTPHPGEFGRLSTAVMGAWDAALSAKTGNDSHRTMAAACLANADTSGQIVVVLKGSHTVVTNGNRYSINHTGNPGMATGGSGDVLTGVITALLCQGLAPFEAARLGVYVHGLAGDLAAADLGQVSLIASDLIHFLPRAFRGF
jgi:NAD(P)H-hydrate epimerase